MKKIIFNGKSISEKEIIGVGRYTYEIIREFDKICSDLDVEVLIPSKSEVIPVFSNIKVKKYGGKKTRKLWGQISFFFYLLKYHAVGVNLDGKPPLLRPDITCKHDVTHLLAPKIYIGNSKKRIKAWILHNIVDFSLKHFAKVIVTVSEHSSKDISKYYNIDISRIKVIGNAWQHFNRISYDMRIFDKFPVIQLENYFFGLGAQNKNKNFEWIIENAKKYPKNQYVIAGRYYASYGEILNYKKCNNIIFLGYVSNEELKALMMHCKAFLFPSFYEGFGIPPLEAISVGKDAIVSKSSCLPEIYEDAVYYIDPMNPNVDLCKLMSQYKISNEKKERILEKYSWEKSAKQLKDLIINLYQ